MEEGLLAEEASLLAATAHCFAHFSLCPLRPVSILVRKLCIRPRFGLKNRTVGNVTLT